MNANALKRWIPLILLITLLVFFFSFGLNEYLSFSNLRDHRSSLMAWTQSHVYLASLIFMVCYTLSVSISIPGAVFLTLGGGFLFGIIWGAVLVIISATLGATLLFFAVQSALGELLAKRASGWIERMRLGFQNNAFSYLLSLRLIPLFPFWVVNIVPALLGVSSSTFIMATLIGIIPGSLVYVSVGNGLGELFAINQTPNLGILFTPKIALPLLALSILSLLPVFLKKKGPPTLSDLLRCDIAIIGAGAAGLSIASGCAQLGLNVVLIESGKMGGDCLNYGCVPSKSLLAAAKLYYQAQYSTVLGIKARSIKVNFFDIMQQVKQVIDHIAYNDSVERFESLGVQVIQETARFIGANQLQVKDTIIEAKYIVIATGSSPIEPPIPGLDKVSFLTNETIFNVKEQPKHLIVIGGGPIGCELAQAFAMLGSRVTILEAAAILPKDDADCVAIVREQLLAMHLLIYEQSKIQYIDSCEEGVSVQFEFQDKTLSITGTHLLIATGRKANINGLDLEKAGVEYTAKGIKTNKRLQTSNKKIYAIGDVAGSYQFTHLASYQAGIALRNIVFKIPAAVDYQAVPWVTYTVPELAQVGMLSEKALTHPKMKITEFAFVDVDRAQTEGTTKGKIKVITDKKARILGVSIVGAHAGELILPWVMAIREGKSLRAFTDVIAPYPTLSEISKRVASEYYKPVLFSTKTRRLVRWLNKLG